MSDNEAETGAALELSAVDVFRDGLNPDLGLLGVLPVKVDRRTALTGEVLEEPRRGFVVWSTSESPLN